MIDTQAKRFIPVVKNSTKIPSKVIEQIANLIAQPGTAKTTLVIRNSPGRVGVSGYAYRSGQISLCIGELEGRYLTKGREGKGYLVGIALGSRREAILKVLAHELRHRWQHVNRHPRVHGSKGRYSERDADAWALGVLRRYRRGEIAGLAELMAQIPEGKTPAQKLAETNLEMAAWNQRLEAEKNLPLNSDWPVAILKALAKIPGVTGMGGDLAAPDGFRWAANESHYLSTPHSGSDCGWAAIQKDLAMGLEACPSECECLEDRSNRWDDQPKPDWSKPYSPEAIELGGNDWTDRPAPVWVA